MMININNPAYCTTLPRNTSRYANTYRNYIKNGKWDMVEGNCVLYSEAVEEYLACKQVGIKSDICIRKPESESINVKLQSILRRLGATEEDLWGKQQEPAAKEQEQKLVTEQKATSKPASQKPVNHTQTAPKAVTTVNPDSKPANQVPDSVKLALKELLKNPATAIEKEIAGVLAKAVIKSDRSVLDRMGAASKELNVTPDDIMVAMMRTPEFGMTVEELEAFYTLLKKFGDVEDLGDIIVECMKGGDSDTVNAIITQIEEDVKNGLEKAETIDGNTIKALKTLLSEDDVNSIVSSKAIPLPDNSSVTDKQPAVQVDNTSKPGEKPVQAPPVEPDRANGFVNHNLPVINKYAGLIDLINIGCGLGYTTKLTERDDGFVTAEVFAQGVYDPISRLIVDPGVLHIPAMGYAILVPDSGTSYAPSYNDITMSDYIYINDPTEYVTIAHMMSGNKLSADKRKEISDACYEGKKVNALVDYRSIPKGLDYASQYILGEVAIRLLSKGVKVRGSIKEVGPNTMKLEFTSSSAGSLTKYYNNTTYGDFMITTSLEGDNVKIDVIGNKKAQMIKKLRKLLG